MSPPPATTTADEIADALKAFGRDHDSAEPSAAGRAARVRLETLPTATLGEVLPALWTQEEAKRRQRLRYGILKLITLLTVIVLVYFLVAHGLIPNWLTQVLPFVGVFFGGAGPLLSARELTPLQRGMVRLLLLRPHVALVPLLVSALPLLKQAEKTALRPRLTELFPLWCEQDSADLTPTQQTILLREIKQVMQGGTLLTRTLGGPDRALTIPEADFVLAAISTLRRSRAAPDQARTTRRILAGLPAPTTASDPRHEIHTATQVLLTGTHQR